MKIRPARAEFIYADRKTARLT